MNYKTMGLKVDQRPNVKPETIRYLGEIKEKPPLSWSR